MPELLLELGCEELPATFVRKAFCDLHANVEKGLREAGISFEDGHPPIGTPRRLIIHFSNVADRQPDREQESRGPALPSAFDSDGNPTKALEGFCRGQGVLPGDVERRDGYVWVKKTISGKPTIDLLAELLPQAIRGLTFEKTMRWGGARMRFARPIRWILASFGGEAVSFDIEGVTAGLESRGHRFYAPEPFTAKSYDELVNGLIARKVEPDPAEREKTIRETAIRQASGMPELDDRLVDENVFLTEWPTPIEGSFKEEYLKLPEAVLITAMAKHEKMFPVRGTDGKLLNKFVFVRNSGEDATVRSGSEWVLNARFNDAKFFFDEDQKHTLKDFLAKTERIVFQEKLGTVRQRADRLSELGAAIAAHVRLPAETVELVKQAGLYAKADLSCGLVSELANLQGIIGGEYGRRDGLAEPVCQAIAAQYDWNAIQDLAGPSADVAACLLLADQLDKLAGYLGIGSIPSGSSDPFGLRRAATYVIEVSWAKWPLDVVGLLNEAAQTYVKQGVTLDVEGMLQAAKDIFEGRYQTLLSGARYDLLEAALLADSLEGPLRPHEVRFRLDVLQRLGGDVAFVQTATRPINIVRSAQEKGAPFDQAGLVDGASLNSAEGQALANELASFWKADLRNQDGLLTALKGLEQPINAFFDSTMVMSQVESERFARLSLVQGVSLALKTAGDFTKIVIDGAE
jgi:glycyl-tRNA synthetase beta chain